MRDQLCFRQQQLWLISRLGSSTITTRALYHNNKYKISFFQIFLQGLSNNIGQYLWVLMYRSIFRYYDFQTNLFLQWITLGLDNTWIIDNWEIYFSPSWAKKVNTVTDVAIICVFLSPILIFTASGPEKNISF